MPNIEKGFEQGVSACYVATYDNCLYIAGGCNFPETPAAQGGAKRYYKGIYKAYINDTLEWEQCGELPYNSAYGANIQTGNLWIIAGGMDENGARNNVITIDLANNCKKDTLPSLPYKIDNTAGTACGNRIFVTGGNANGSPSTRTFMLCLNKIADGWTELPTMPQRARVQPVCAATENFLYVWGGFTPADSTREALTHTNGVCYDIVAGTWNIMPDVIITDSTAITLSGGVATLLNDSTIVAAGGVNKEIFTDAVSGKYTLVAKEEYMHKPIEWYSFNPNLLSYNIPAKKWELLLCSSSFARAGAAMTTYDNGILYIGGELKPGIRTPQIHCYKF